MELTSIRKAKQPELQSEDLIQEEDEIKGFGDDEVLNADI